MKSALQKIKNISNASEIDPQELKEILFAILENYPVGQRNPKHINLISQALLTIDFFRKLEDVRGEDSIRLCAIQLRYEKHLQNTNIIVHGERGDKFYIILQGICEIHVPNSQGQFVKVGELKAGQSFGELALINDSPRRATIKASTDCDLAILSKQDYIKIIADMEEREIKKKIQFMESLPLFNQIHRRAMHEYIYYFKIVNYKWKDIVYSQGEQPQFVYVIKSGEFILQKFSRQEKSQNYGIFPITAQVAIIGPGEIFGEVDCLLNEKHHFSVSCHSQTAELFIISKKHFNERIMDNYNIREKNFVENYLNKKILWRNERMNNIKTAKKIAEQEVQLGFSKLSPNKRSKKESIQYDQNKSDYGSNFNSPYKQNRNSQGFNFMITEIIENNNPSLITGGHNSPGSFSYLGKQNQRQTNLRSISTATPQLSKRASSAFPTSKGRNDTKNILTQIDHQSIGTIEETPFNLLQNNQQEEEISLKENSSNLANSNLLDALILSSPLKNKLNQNLYVRLKDLPQIKMNPCNRILYKKSDSQNYSNQRSDFQNGKESSPSPEKNEINEQEGMKKFLKTNSAVYKMRKLNQAKLEICKQQNIDVQRKSFKNIGIIEDVELPKYILNKLKNQNALMSLMQRGQSPKTIGQTTGTQTTQISNPFILSPQKKRSISNNNYQNYNNNANIIPQSKNNNIFENEFQKINGALSAPLQRIENDKLKSMITQMRFIDSQQYKIQTQMQQQQNTASIQGNKSLIVSPNRDESILRQNKYKRSVSPITVQNKNSSILMHKFMITPFKNNQSTQQSTKHASQYTIHWDHTPEPNSPPIILNPLVNLSHFQVNSIKL